MWRVESEPIQEWTPRNPADEEVLKGKGKPRLLLVDDEEAALDVMTTLFEEHDIEVHATLSGVEALELIEKQIFHVVMTDLLMRPVDGKAVLQKAKERFPWTEVIIITGFASLDRALEAIHHHAFDFVEKPFDIDKLERIVLNALNQSRLAIENRRLLMELQAQNQALEEKVRLATRELAELAVRDELTGLYNYRYLLTSLESEISRALRYSRPLSMAMIDLDRFKRYNDCHGHMAGNEALKRIARSMTEEIRRSDTVVRYGGEEFVIILPETGKAEASAILDRVRQEIRNLNLEYTSPNGEKGIVTLSAGIATCPEDSQDLDEFIRRADTATYAAKGRGGDQLAVASPDPEICPPAVIPQENRLEED